MRIENFAFVVDESKRLNCGSEARDDEEEEVEIEKEPDHFMSQGNSIFFIIAVVMCKSCDSKLTTN